MKSMLNQTDTQQEHPVACYGMTCPHRASCELHAMLGLLDGHVIATCQKGDDWPLFILKGESFS